MNIHKLQLGFFIALIAGVLVLNFFIFLPYVSVIFLAGIFAIIFEPIHKRILAFWGGRETVAAVFSVLVVLIFIFTPLAIFGILLFQESSDVYVKITAGNSDIVGVTNQAIATVQNFIHDRIPQFSFDIRSHINLQQYAGKTLSWLSNHLAVFFSSVLRGVLGFFLMILALFYFFHDGRRFIFSLRQLSPLFDVYDDRIINKLAVAVNSVVRGQLTVAVVQGILTGFGFWVFGIPNPVIWGAVAAIASLIPVLGTSMVLIPGIIYLFFTNNMFGTVGLLIWAVCAVGLIDNLLGPFVMKRGIKIHSFIILISVLGGISLFGPIGFIAGPVALSLLFVLLDMYPTIIQSEKTL